MVYDRFFLHPFQFIVHQTQFLPRGQKSIVPSGIRIPDRQVNSNNHVVQRMHYDDMFYDKFIPIYNQIHYATTRTVPGSISGGFFLRGTPDRTMCPEVEPASESEYQRFLLGSRRPGRLTDDLPPL